MTEMFIVEQHRLPKAFKRQDVQPKTKFVIFSLMMLHISCTIAGDYSLMSQGQIQRGVVLRARTFGTPKTSKRGKKRRARAFIPQQLPRPSPFRIITFLVLWRSLMGSLYTTHLLILFPAISPLLAGCFMYHTITVYQQ